MSGALGRIHQGLTSSSVRTAGGGPCGLHSQHSCAVMRSNVAEPSRSPSVSRSVETAALEVQRGPSLIYLLFSSISSSSSSLEILLEISAVELQTSWPGASWSTSIVIASVSWLLWEICAHSCSSGTLSCLVSRKPLSASAGLCCGGDGGRARPAGAEWQRTLFLSPLPTLFLGAVGAVPGLHSTRWSGTTSMVRYSTKTTVSSVADVELPQAGRPCRPSTSAPSRGQTRLRFLAACGQEEERGEILYKGIFSESATTNRP